LGGGGEAEGYAADVLDEVADAVLRARRRALERVGRYAFDESGQPAGRWFKIECGHDGLDGPSSSHSSEDGDTQ
jgi:hypothetical protein